ncbi:unnamed protein product [Amoebophrya sp. A25]|nr:unnamed protein product [Amoebophrya sp. A25]|eukprot:GSA25T00015463001.1
MRARRFFRQLQLLVAALQCCLGLGVKILEDPVFLRQTSVERWLPKSLYISRRVILKHTLYYSRDRGAFHGYRKKKETRDLLPPRSGQDTDTSTLVERWNRFSAHFHPSRLFLESRDSASNNNFAYLDSLVEDDSTTPVAYVQFESKKEFVELLHSVCSAAEDEEGSSSSSSSSSSGTTSSSSIEGGIEDAADVQQKQKALAEVLRLVEAARQKTARPVVQDISLLTDAVSQIEWPEWVLDADVYLEEKDIDADAHTRQPDLFKDYVPRSGRLVTTGGGDATSSSASASSGGGEIVSQTLPLPAFYDDAIDLVWDHFGSDRGAYCGRRPGSGSACGNYYGRVYEEILFGREGHDRKHWLRKRCDSNFRILEIGIGSVSAQNPGGPMTWIMQDRLNKHYKPGPGLRSWRALFPRAHIDGWDIDPEAMIRDERNIHTAVVNSMNRTAVEAFVRADERTRKERSTLEKLSVPQGSSSRQENAAGALPAEQQHESSTSTGVWDLIIDDGLHTSLSVTASFVFLFRHLKLGGIYFWEDIRAFLTDLAGFSRYLFGGSPREYHTALSYHGDIVGIRGQRARHTAQQLAESDELLLQSIEAHQGRSGDEVAREKESFDKISSFSDLQEKMTEKRTHQQQDATAFAPVKYLSHFRWRYNSIQVRNKLLFDWGNYSTFENFRFATDRAVVAHVMKDPETLAAMGLAKQVDNDKSSLSKLAKGSDIQLKRSLHLWKHATSSSSTKNASSTLSLGLGSTNEAGEVSLARSSSARDHLQTDETATSRDRDGNHLQLLLESRLLYHKFLRDDSYELQKDCVFDDNPKSIRGRRRRTKNSGRGEEQQDEDEDALLYSTPEDRAPAAYFYDLCCKEGVDPKDENKRDCFSYKNLGQTAYLFSVCCAATLVRNALRTHIL